MGIFLFILIIIAVRILLNNNNNLKKKYLQLISLLVIIQILNINGRIAIFSYQFLISIIVFLYTIYLIYKENIIFNRYLIFFAMAFLFSVFIGVFQEIVYPYEGLIINYEETSGWTEYLLGSVKKETLSISYKDVFALYFRVFMYTLEVCVIKTICNKYDLLYIVNNILKYTRIVIYYGFVEYILKNILENPNITQNFLLFMFNGKGQLSIRGEEYGLVGFTAEPSHLIIFLFMVAVINILVRKIIIYKSNYKKYLKYNKYDIFLILLLMILSGGFSALWYMCILILLYAILKIEKREINIRLIIKIFMTLIILLVIGTILINVMYLSNEYISKRIDVVFDAIAFINGNLNNSDIFNLIYYGGFDGGNLSTLARFLSIHDVFMDFCNRPLLGLGLGMQVAHGNLAMLFCDFGLVGVYFLIKLSFFKIDKSVKYDKIFLFIFLVLANLPMGLRGIGFELYIFCIIEMTKIYK